MSQPISLSPETTAVDKKLRRFYGTFALPPWVMLRLPGEAEGSHRGFESMAGKTALVRARRMEETILFVRGE